MMMMDNRENSLDRELIGHLQHVHFGGQHDIHPLHGWGEFMDRFNDCQMESRGVNGSEVRNKGPSPCNSQASLGYHSLPSSQCGSRPGSNPDYTVDYNASVSYEPSAMYLDSEPIDSCWRHNNSGQLEMPVKGINQGQSVCKESIRKSIDMEWRQWCHQQQERIACTGNSHNSNGYHRNGYHGISNQLTDNVYPQRTCKQQSNKSVQQNGYPFPQRNHKHSVYQDDSREPLHGNLIPLKHQRSMPVQCMVHRQRYEQPIARDDMLSRSLNACSQFRTRLQNEDPIYEEIVEHSIIRSHDKDNDETPGPNLPPRPKSWTSMVNLHQRSKAPVYYQIEPGTQYHDCSYKAHHEHAKVSDSCKTNRGVSANTGTFDHYNRSELNSIKLPFPYINRLFEEDSETSENNEIDNSPYTKTNEKKSGKIEKFFGSLLSLNKSKGVKNMGTSTDEKGKDENNIEKHRKLRRTVSESCSIYSKGKCKFPTYEDDMCNLLKEIQLNMKEIDYNSKKLHQNFQKDKRVKNSEMKMDKQGERKNSRRDKKSTIKTEHKKDKTEREHNHSHKKYQSKSMQSPHHYIRNSSGLEKSGLTKNVNHHTIKTVVNESCPGNSGSESCNKSQGNGNPRKSGSRPAMGVQALLTRSTNCGSMETNCNKSTANEENNTNSEPFERRLSHERVGSRLSFVYNYSEPSDSEDSDSEVVGALGYTSEAYAQGLASGEDNENWKDGDQVYGVSLAKPLFRNNVVATAKRRKLIEKVTEL